MKLIKKKLVTTRWNCGGKEYKSGEIVEAREDTIAGAIEGGVVFEDVTDKEVRKPND